MCENFVYIMWEMVYKLNKVKYLTLKSVIYDTSNEIKCSFVFKNFARIKLLNIEVINQKNFMIFNKLAKYFNYFQMKQNAIGFSESLKLIAQFLREDQIFFH